jgi:Icc-related predicted phosphoesterase
VTSTLRIAALADLHVTKSSTGAFAPVFARAAAVADVLLLCGDLTDYGLEEEARVLARECQGVGIPVLAVLGNHDFESGTPEVVSQVLSEAGVQVLDGDSVEVKGVGFAGVKGFCGGFGRRMLEPWGEASIKSFVHEGLEEGLKLERALSRLRTPQKVAITHYAPIAATVAGEPPEIFPFLGSSRLEEPCNRYGVGAAFHGHAHRGSPEGRTSSGIPVYNVALPLLRRTWPEGPHYRLVEVPTEPELVEAGAAEPRRRRDDHA